MSPESIRNALEFYGEPESYAGFERTVLEAARVHAEWLEQGRLLTVGGDHKLESALSMWPGRYFVVPLGEEAR